ncbi:hypothetical protein HJ590_09195 [Naumannella sp. ID2617S]|nr:hypothetical protein [Naumannella sp. ID2617S]
MQPAPLDPVQVTLGPPEHGVTRYAAQLARAAGGPSQRQRALADAPPPTGPFHLHLTPALCGRTPEAAAEALLTWLDRAPTRPTVTLHDLPQPSDGHEMFGRRARCVARWLGTVAGVVVSSEHEAALLAECAPDATATVIPLPVDPPTAALANRPGDSVGVLGFVYPGKGHAEAIDAAGAQRPPAPVEVLGAVSAGHDQLLAELGARAVAAGVALRVSRHLDEAAWSAAIARVGVPLALHRHLSASGSINSWIAHRRRPVVLRGRATTELDRLRPGTLTLVEPDQVADAVAEALRDPGRTLIAPDHPLGPDTAAVLAGYRDFWAATW